MDTNGNPVTHYLAVGVIMMGGRKLGSAKLILDVCGFKERHGGGIDILYDTLASVSKTEVGSIEYIEIGKFLSSGQMKEWISQSIAFLKKQLRWPEHVQNALDAAGENSKGTMPIRPTIGYVLCPQNTTTF